MTSSTGVAPGAGIRNLIPPYNLREVGNFHHKSFAMHAVNFPRRYYHHPHHRTTYDVGLDELASHTDDSFSFLFSPYGIVSKVRSLI